MRVTGKRSPLMWPDIVFLGYATILVGKDIALYLTSELSDYGQSTIVHKEEELWFLD